MDVILLERIEKLGQMGDVVSVKPGYARNYLLPTNKALRATKANVELFETQRKQLEADNLNRRDEASQVAERMQDLQVVVIRNAGDSGQLYGSVTARDIADAVSAAGFTVRRTQVVMERPVKTLGIFDFRIRLHPEVDAVISVNVARSEAEAEQQAKLGRAVVGTDEEQLTDEEEALAEAEAQAEALFEPEAQAEAVETLASEILETAEEANAGEEPAVDESAEKTE